MRHLLIESVRGGPLDDLRGPADVRKRSDVGGNRTSGLTNRAGLEHCPNSGTNLCRIEGCCADNPSGTKRAAPLRVEWLICAERRDDEWDSGT